MKQKLMSLLLALALCLGLLPAAYAAPAGGPAVSSNKNKQDYSTWATTVKSYLYENPSGGLTRVEYTGKEIVAEDYDSAFQFQASRAIPMELSIWGGFYAGKDYNFLIFGQNNKEQNDDKEVIRVVKYSKDWQRLGQASLKGANTTVPFDAGSLRCDEYGGYLYIRTCHEMYKSSDGLNHQSNLTMAVKQDDMTITDSFYRVMNTSYGYVSHSFNQFILIDSDGKIVAIDHGDAYPRGVAFTKYYADAGAGKFTNASIQGRLCAAGTSFEFAGATGQNATGASVGGLAETTDCYIYCYNYNGTGSGSGDRYPYYHYMDKASGKSWSVKINLPGSTTPVLAPLGLDGGYMLWNGKSGNTANDTLYYLHYGADGTPEQYKTAKGSLSDCQPIAYNGKAVWYVTDNSAPTFYALDASGVTATPAGGSSQPTDPTKPTDPAKPLDGIMTNSNSTFLYDGDSSYISADGAATISGVKLPGGRYTAVALDTMLYSWFLLREDGTLWNADCHEIWGQAEDPTLDDLHLTKLLDNVVQIQPGMALQKDGTLWTDDYVEGSNASLNKFMTGVKQISSGQSVRLAVKTDGTLWSWGDTLEFYSNQPNPELGWKAPTDNWEDGTPPTKILDSVAYVAGSMAIRTDGTLWSWGSNDGGLVGDGSGYHQYTPVKILDNVIGAWSVSSGAFEAKYALTKDGSVYSWGYNSGGVLGFEGGNKESPANPMAGTPGYKYQTVPRKSNLTGVVNIMDGCYAQKADGSVWEIGAGGFERRVEANVKVLAGWPNVDGTQPTKPEDPYKPVSPDFSDVSKTNWAYEFVMKCADQKIVNGKGGGRFDPDGDVTYAQFAKMLVTAFYPETLAQCHTHPNAAGKSWYWEYMQAAYNSALFGGTAVTPSRVGNGGQAGGQLILLPDSAVNAWANVSMSRYDMAEMAFNTLRRWSDGYYDPAQDITYLGIDFQPYIPTYMAMLKDGGGIPANRREAIAACMHMGIIKGMGDGSFAGAKTMTRAQSCKVMITLMEAVEQVKLEQETVRGPYQS